MAIKSIELVNKQYGDTNAREIYVDLHEEVSRQVLRGILISEEEYKRLTEDNSEATAMKQYGKSAAEWYQEYAQAQNEIKVLQSKLANAQTTLQAVQEENELAQGRLQTAEQNSDYFKAKVRELEDRLSVALSGHTTPAEVEGLEQFNKDAQLGRLVRQMPTDYHLLRAKDFWKCGRLDGWKSNGYDTPEEALIAAGIGQSELPETQDFEPDKENCSVFMANSGKAYPRTCKVCGLGPCFFKLQMKTAETQEVTATEPPAGEKKPERFTCDCVKYFSILAGEKWLPFKYCHECGGTGVKYQSRTHSDDGLPITPTGFYPPAENVAQIIMTQALKRGDCK